MAALRLYGRLVAPITITRDLLSVTMPSHSLQAKEKKKEKQKKNESERKEMGKREGCMGVGCSGPQNHGRTVAEEQKVRAYVMKTDSTCMW
jgi:hypothetical protein